MSYSLPSIPPALIIGGFLLFLLGIGLPTSVAAPQPPSPAPSDPPPQLPSPPPTAPPPPGSPETIEGQLLIRESVEQLLRQPPLEAKVRQRATIHGQLVAGAGLYAQAERGGQLQVRYEFKLQVGSRSLGLLQVNDGSTLWIRREAAGLKSQAYVNLRRLREALDAHPERSRDTTDVAAVLAVGGLPQLLRSLGDRFEWGEGIATEAGGTPVWEMKGTWKPKQLALLVPEQGSTLNQGAPPRWNDLPAHIPSHIKLTLGRDRNFPLFPYRIEYQRVVPVDEKDPQAAAKPPLRPLVTLEFFEVQRRKELPGELFQFVVGDEEVEDQTEEYLRKLGLLPLGPAQE